MGLGKNMNFTQHISTQRSEKQDVISDQNSDTIQSVTENIVPEKTADSVINKIQKSTQAEAVPDFLHEIISSGFTARFTPSRRKTTRRVGVLIEGELTIQSALVLKDRMNHVFENYDFVDFTIRNVQQVDLAGIQFFYFLKKLFVPQGKTISVDAEFSKEDRQLIDTCGFQEIFLKSNLSV